MSEGADLSSGGCALVAVTVILLPVAGTRKGYEDSGTKAPDMELWVCSPIFFFLFTNYSVMFLITLSFKKIKIRIKN